MSALSRVQISSRFSGIFFCSRLNCSTSVRIISSLNFIRNSKECLHHLICRKHCFLNVSYIFVCVKFFFQMKTSIAMTFQVTLLLCLTLTPLVNARMDPCPATCQGEVLIPCGNRCKQEKDIAYIECQEDCFKKFHKCIDDCHERTKQEEKRAKNKEHLTSQNDH